MMFPKEPSTLSSSECIEACLRCMVTCQDVAILFLEKGMKARLFDSKADAIRQHVVGLS